MKNYKNIIKIVVVSVFLIIVFVGNFFLLIAKEGDNKSDSNIQITSKDITIVLKETETTTKLVENQFSETNSEITSEEIITPMPTTTQHELTTSPPTTSPVETQPPTEIPTTTPVETQPPTEIPTTTPLATQLPTEIPTTPPVETQPPTTIQTEPSGTITIQTELSNVDTENYVNEVIRLVNVERNNAGLSSLTRNSKLCDLALIRAVEIVELFSHNRPNGSDCFTIFDEYGFVINGYAGENLAKGHRTPEEVVKGWMNSQGHKENILGVDFKEIGIGIVKVDGVIYWTQLFYGSIN